MLDRLGRQTNVTPRLRREKTAFLGFPAQAVVVA